MTPLGIEILLHAYARSGPIEDESFPAQQEELRSMQTNGLIEKDGENWKTTERGRAHVIQLCSLSWPISTWVNGHGKVIE